MTGVVRPFEARVVRQEWAAQAVTPMVDALGERRPPTPVPATAYEDSATGPLRLPDAPRRRTTTSASWPTYASTPSPAAASAGTSPSSRSGSTRWSATTPTCRPGPSRSPCCTPTGRPRPRRVADICRGRPLLHFPGPEGLEHTVWRVAGDDATTDLADALDGGGPLHRRRPPSRGRAAPRLGSSGPAGRRRGAVHALRDGRAHHVGVPPAGLRPPRRHRAARRRGRPLRGAAGGHAPTRPSGIGDVRRGVLVRPRPDGRPSRRSGRTDASLLQDRLLGPGAGHLRAGTPPARGAARARPA